MSITDPRTTRGTVIQTLTVGHGRPNVVEIRKRRYAPAPYSVVWLGWNGRGRTFYISVPTLAAAEDHALRCLNAHAN